MERDRFGLVGGLVADRPILTLLVLAFGLAALAAIGASGAAPGGAFAVGELEIAGLALTALPLFLAGAAPRTIGLRIIIGLAVAAGAAALYVYGPLVPGGGVAAPAARAFVLLTWLLLAAGPLFGAMARFAFIAVGAGLVGMAGGFGLMLRQGLGVGESGPAVISAFAIAAIVGAGAVADFAALYAGGADRRRAAGLAAGRAVAPSVYGAFAAALAFGGAAGLRSENAEWLMLSGLAGLAVILCALPALAASAGALCLRQESEMMAVEENRRRQAFRRLWRPMRAIFPPNASLALIAIAAIAVVAAAFNMPGPMPAFHLVFAISGAAAAGLVFFSLRAGLFVFYLLIASSALGGWLWGTIKAPALSLLDQAAALALAAALFGSLAATWRDARSPRLNPRETTEAAMTDGLGGHVFGAILTLAGFYAGKAAGVWPGGLAAGGYLALMAAIGILLAPALMTALSHMAPRELA